MMIEWPPKWTDYIFKIILRDQPLFLWNNHSSEYKFGYGSVFLMIIRSCDYQLYQTIIFDSEKQVVSGKGRKWNALKKKKNSGDRDFYQISFHTDKTLSNNNIIFLRCKKYCQWPSGHTALLTVRRKYLYMI